MICRSDRIPAKDYFSKRWKRDFTGGQAAPGEKSTGGGAGQAFAGTDAGKPAALGAGIDLSSLFHGKDPDLCCGKNGHVTGAGIQVGKEDSYQAKGKPVTVTEYFL